jgi:hypothetical protein
MASYADQLALIEEISRSQCSDLGVVYSSPADDLSLCLHYAKRYVRRRKKIKCNSDESCQGPTTQLNEYYAKRLKFNSEHINWFWG